MVVYITGITANEYILFFVSPLQGIAAQIIVVFDLRWNTAVAASRDEPHSPNKVPPTTFATGRGLFVSRERAVGGGGGERLTTA